MVSLESGALHALIFAKLATVFLFIYQITYYRRETRSIPAHFIYAVLLTESQLLSGFIRCNGNHWLLWKHFDIYLVSFAKSRYIVAVSLTQNDN